MPAIAADGDDPLPAELGAVDAVVEGATEPLTDIVALPDEPAGGGMPADGSADDAPDIASNAGPGGAEAAEKPLVDVISEAVERDIAPVVGALVELPDAEAAAPADEPQAPEPDASQAPDERAPQSAFDAIESVLETAEDPEVATTDRADAPRESTLAPDHPPRYQGDSAQYHSDAISDGNSWTWKWYLELDCEGIRSSIFEENGTSSSENWAWIWNWNWNCGFEGASEQAAETLTESPPVSVAAGGDSTPAADADVAGATWLWTWTFTFCGRTMTIVTPLAVDPELRWLWEWTWTWACTTAAPVPVETAVPGLDAEVLDASVPLPWLDHAVRFDDVADEVVGDSLLAFGSVPSVRFPLAAAPSTHDVPRPELRADAPATVATTPPARPVATVPPAGAVAELELRADVDERAGVQPEPRARRHDASSQRLRTPRAPADTSPLGTPSAPASSGSAPGGSSGGSGIAALTGFVVLATPGLGRRIREARELSPRAPVRDRLERPG